MKYLVGIVLIIAGCGKVHASYTCSGEVYGLSVNPKSGQVLAERAGGLDWPVLCSLKSEANGVSIETCKGIYSMLLGAQMAQKDVMFWFNDEASGGSCSSHNAWGFLTGWYFGPMLK